MDEIPRLLSFWGSEEFSPPTRKVPRFLRFKRKQTNKPTNEVNCCSLSHANSPQLCAAWFTPSLFSVVPLWTIAFYSNFDAMRNVPLNVPLDFAGSLLGLSDPQSLDPTLMLHSLFLSSFLWSV